MAKLKLPALTPPATTTPPVTTPTTPAATFVSYDANTNMCTCANSPTHPTPFVVGEGREDPENDCRVACTGGTPTTPPAPENDDEDEDEDDDNKDNDDNDDAIDRVTKRAKEKQKITSASKKQAVSQKKKQCSGFTGATKSACEASLARVHQKQAFRGRIFRVLNPN